MSTAFKEARSGYNPEYRRQYYLKNKVKALVQSKARYVRKKAAVLAMQKARVSTPEGAAKRKIYMAAYTAKNRESMRQYQADYHRRNLDAIKEKRARHRERTRDYHRARRKRYYSLNKDRHYVRVRNRQIMKKSVTVNLALIEEFTLKVRRSKTVRCYYCDVRISGKKANIDHVLPLKEKGPHEIGNLCTSCEFCNKSKGAKLLGKWKKPGQQVLPL